MKKIAIVSALSLVLALGLFGCSGSGQNTSSSEPTSASQSSSAAAGQSSSESQAAAGDTVTWKGPSHVVLDKYLLTGDGPSIQAEAFSYDEAGDGYVRLYLKNNTNDAITVTAAVKINGEAVDVAFNEKVEALGEVATDLFLVGEELAAQGVEQVIEVSVVFTVEGTGDTLASDELLIDLASL